MKEELKKKRKIEELRKRSAEAVEDMERAKNNSRQAIENLNPNMGQSAKNGADVLQEDVNVAKYGEENYKAAHQKKKKK